MNQDIEKILLTKEEIEKKVTELGQEITSAYAGKMPLVICVLKGAAPFMTDLIRHIELPIEIDFMAVSSYGSSTESSGVVRILKDLETSSEGRDVLIVEDIIDSGLTLRYLVDLLKSRNVNSVRIATLLDKPGRRTIDLTPDFLGFSIPDEFVVGYGLDYNEQYRNLPYIGILKREVYEHKE
ncbi:hypoxanthine phosphoribosyltransferase [Rubeoparvulum massiliense]|uniref:hypoxanthine phosphoribosyltransferase n=1 Tax=Rubeoparvulum massiliense TaxID=1631346 RepID=UPI00065E1057|nr:hypoxanthine phosphoribosyltransferase [Rubeoparvulum massiliense]